MKSRMYLTATLALLVTGSAAFAQGAKSDYERARTITRKLNGKVRNANIQPRWLNGGTQFSYQRQTPGGGYETLIVDSATGKRQPVVDSNAVRKPFAATLTKLTGKPVQANRIKVLGHKTGSDGALYFVAQHDNKLYFGKSAHGDDVKLTKPGDDHPFKLRALPVDTPTRWRRQGEESAVIFYNDTDREVELFYVSSNGDGRQSYGKLAPGEMKNQHTFGGHRWLVVVPQGKELATFFASNELAVAHITGQPPKPAQRPHRQSDRPSRRNHNRRPPANGGRVTVRDHNLYLAANGGDPVALTTDGAAENYYGHPMSYSPDGRYVVATRTVPGERRMVTFVQSSPRDQVQPKVHSFAYAKPGDKLDHRRPVIVDLETKKLITIDNDLFPNPYRNFDLRWRPDGKRFTFLYNQRGHQVMRLIEVDAATGKARAVIDERCETFFDYSQKRYLHRLEKTGEAIWMSERNGWNHLYLYDTEKGELINAITSGDWVVRDVEHVDAERRVIWFRAVGVYKGQDPYFVHYGRVNFDGSNLVWLTDGNGTHSASFSPDRGHLVVSYSRVDLPPVTELRDGVTGKRVAVLERADATEWKKVGVRMPEPFVAKGRDGKTDIWGVIHRPSNFDARRKYPVIEQIYAGPHDQHVPKSWRSAHGAQRLAEIGFIVVQIDGMGTNWRSKAFHDVCWQNIGDAGFPDRIAWMKAAAKKYPHMDISRVGIYGGSAGGQNALGALLFHGEFYDAASADCGCHDNRMDKIWWNEAWMGWPVGDHYARSSNVENAHKLQGKLLLMVGEMDRNVDPASTMQVVDALIKADKDFELVVFPGGGHGAGSSAYGRRRMTDFFVRNLWGLEPRRAG